VFKILIEAVFEISMLIGFSNLKLNVEGKSSFSDLDSTQAGPCCMPSALERIGENSAHILALSEHVHLIYYLGE